MDTLIPVSAGLYSAAVLVKWLKTHKGPVLLWNCTLGDGKDTDRSRAFGVLFAKIRMQYPDRVTLLENGYRASSVGSHLPATEMFEFLLKQVLRAPAAAGIKKILIPARDGAQELFHFVKGKGWPELVRSPVNVLEAVELIPCELKELMSCSGPIRCMTCPACEEIENELNPKE